MKIFNLLFYPSHTASSTLRSVIPFSLMAGRRGAEIITIDPMSMERDLLERALDADLYVLNREVPCVVCELLIQKARRDGRRVVYELDDYILKAPDAHPHKRIYDDFRPRIEEILRAVDLVVVSTDALAARIHRLNSRVYVYRNMMPMARPRPRASEPPYVIGYTGLAAHSRELAFVLEVFTGVRSRLGDRAQFKVIGLEDCALPRELSIVRVPSTPDYARYRAILAEADFDIGLGYLAADEFNECKSLCKFLEYAANGTIGVFSNRGPYVELASEGECVLVSDSVDAWVAKIVEIVERISWYRAVGLAGYVFAEGEYDETKADEYYDVLAQLDSNGSAVPPMSDITGVGIFGAAQMGRYCAMLLEALGVTVRCFIDSHLSGARKIDGRPVASPQELRNMPELPVIIASYSHYDEMRKLVADRNTL